MTSPAGFFAPGRINIIGEHTDYSGGYVMPAPLSYGIRFINVKPSTHWDLISLSTGEKFQGNIKDKWTGSHSLMAFIRSIEETAARHKLPVLPLQGVIQSDLPSGSGLSSSTALTSVILAALHHHNDWAYSRREMMILAQEVELNMGIQCGIMDQYCMWQGIREKAILLDCSTLTHREISLKIPGREWYILFSGVKHHLLGSPYNERRQQLFSGIEFLKKSGWTQEDLKIRSESLMKAVMKISDTIVKNRVQYVIEENARVLEMEEALERKDSMQISSILNAGQDGLKDDYNVSCDEIDTLVEVTKHNIPEVGIRMVGGGFGGALVAFVPANGSKISLEKTLADYERMTGKKGVILPLTLGDPVSRIT